MSELLEKILDKRNMNETYKKVCANKGTGGVDGMELNELDEHIRENWDSIREQIRARSYKPQPVRRVEIPKPNGSKRKLGIPTVMDRVIQQGITQAVSPMCEMVFSENSYGFRPNRSCEMAVRETLIFLNEGYEWIVDIDLEKFFDNERQLNLKKEMPLGGRSPGGMLKELLLFDPKSVGKIMRVHKNVSFRSRRMLPLNQEESSYTMEKLKKKINVLV